MLNDWEPRIKFVLGDTVEADGIIDDFQKALSQERQKGRQEVIEELETSGYGGGNWRRILEQLKQKFNL